MFNAVGILSPLLSDIYHNHVRGKNLRFQWTYLQVIAFVINVGLSQFFWPISPPIVPGKKSSSALKIVELSLYTLRVQKTCLLSHNILTVEIVESKKLNMPTELLVKLTVAFDCFTFIQMQF